MSAGDDIGPDRLAALMSRAVADLADANAALMTSLDLQARILAALEARELDEVVEEISVQLKRRRREALRELDQWSDSLETGGRPN